MAPIKAFGGRTNGSERKMGGECGDGRKSLSLDEMTEVYPRLDAMMLGLCRPLTMQVAMLAKWPATVLCCLTWAWASLILPAYAGPHCTYAEPTSTYPEPTSTYAEPTSAGPTANAGPTTNAERTVDANASNNQTLAGQSDSAEQATIDAQSSRGLRMAGIAVAPYSRARLGRPFTLHVTVENEADTPQSGLVIARVDAVPEFQAGALAHVPAHASRKVQLRLRLPTKLPTGNSFGLSVSLHAPDDPDHVQLSPLGTPLTDSLTLAVDHEPLVTAVMLDDEPRQPPEWDWPQNLEHMSYELAIAARVDADHSRRTLSIAYQNLPSELIDWEGIDTVVIANDRPLQDIAAMHSMTRWLAGGGRAWIMLDRVKAESLQKLLPDGMSCEFVDDVELNAFTVETDLYPPLSAADRSVEVELPLHMCRITQVGGQVTHRVDGFPAAVRFYVGQGQLLVTTLDARGWLKSRTQPRSDNHEFTSHFQVQPWAQSLVDQFYQVRDPRSPIEQIDIQYPIKHIGNPVLNRSFVLTCLFGFCGALSLCGWWCWQRRQMLNLGWLVPLLSISAALPLLIASGNLRRDLPNTSAHLQLVEVQPGSQNIQATQWTATYMRDANRAGLVSQADAFVSWPSSTQQLDLRRLIWRDYQQWQLTSSGWPHGLWRLKSRFTLPPRDLDVIGHIDRHGLSLKLPAELTQALEDAVVCFTPGDPAVCDRIESGAIHKVSDRHLTAEDSWLGSAIVDDEQSRREEVYQQVPGGRYQSAYPTYPALLGWTKLWPSPIAWEEPRDERGSALVVLPIKLLPVSPGTDVFVPHNVIRLETPTTFDTYSGAFSNLSGRWREEMTLPAIVGMRFHLPHEVLPIDAEEIICDLQLRAPQRQVVVTSLADNTHRTMAELSSPLNAQQIRITDPAILRDARDGIVNLQIEIGNTMGQAPDQLGEQFAAWQIDYFRISVRGQVADH